MADGEDRGIDAYRTAARSGPLGTDRQGDADVSGRVPTLHRQAGFQFFFRATDGSEPPHVHVIGNGGYGKLWLHRSVVVTYLRGYDRSRETKVIRIARRHRARWRRAWAQFFRPR